MADHAAVVAGGAGGLPAGQRHQLTDVELEAVRRFEEKVVRIHPGRDPRNPQRMLYRVVAFVGPGANLTTATKSSDASITSSTSPSKRGVRTQSQVVPGGEANDGDNGDDDEAGQSYYDAAEDDDENDDQQQQRANGGARANQQRQSSVPQQQQQARGGRGRGGAQRGVPPPVPAADARDADEDDVNVEKEQITFGDMEVLGAGSFGSVYRITLLNDASFCAIKKVFQDVRYKNRELSIMRRLKHENIIKLRFYFYTKSSASSQQHQQQQQQAHDASAHAGIAATAAAAAAAASATIPGVDLNLILEYVPETLYAVVKHFYSREKRPVPPVYTAVFMYQVFKALNYLHNCHGICHRDIKPQNILCSIETGVCKVCDFGSAKRLRDGEANVAYICSRYYRAPELIFGLQYYTCSIDLWSTACVMAEVMLGSPIFPGNVPLDQIVEIIKIRGTPSADEIMAMNPKYENRNLPQVQRRSLRDIFQHNQHSHHHSHHHSGSGGGLLSSALGQTGTAAASNVSNQLDNAIFDAEITLLDQLFSYDPTRRPGGLDILMYPLFDCIRLPAIRLPNGAPLPPQLFYFTRWEQSCMRNSKMRNTLMPEHTRRRVGSDGGVAAAAGTSSGSGAPRQVPQQGSKRGSPPGMDDDAEQTYSSSTSTTTAGPTAAGGSTGTTGATRRRSSRQQQQQQAAAQQGSSAVGNVTPVVNSSADGRNPSMPTPRPAGGAGASIASAALGAAASIAGSIRRRASGGSKTNTNVGSGELEGERACPSYGSSHRAHHSSHHCEATESCYQYEPPSKSSSRTKKRSKG